MSEEEQREALRVLHQQRVRELLGQLEQMVRSSTTTAKAEVGEQAASESMEESLAMLEEGIEAVHIVGIDPPTAILEEAREPGSLGTAFVA